MFPKNPNKQPLTFDIQNVKLTSAGPGVAMKYVAKLTNPKPPGKIDSSGTFGPWVTEEPGMTPLKGDYTFKDADLGVFRSIAGILQSTGSFEGGLSNIQARGEAFVPDFRLTMSGNRVPLRTSLKCWWTEPTATRPQAPSAPLSERHTSPPAARSSSTKATSAAPSTLTSTCRRAT